MDNIIRFACAFALFLILNQIHVRAADTGARLVESGVGCGFRTLTPGQIVQISSSNFGVSTYDNYDSCNWSFQAHNCLLAAKCPCFDVPASFHCLGDYLRISDSILYIQRFCGEVAPQGAYRSVSGGLQVRFRSDFGGRAGRGFLCYVFCTQPGNGDPELPLVADAHNCFALPAPTSTLPPPPPPPAPAPPDTGKCTMPAGVNLPIVVDGSGSIQPTDFALAMDFVKQLTRNFPSPSKVAVIVFGTAAKVIVPLLNSLSSAEVERAIDGAVQPQDGTATDIGMATALAQLGLAGGTGRPSKMLVITDGYSGDPTATAAQAAMVKAANVESFSVGVGMETQLSDEELLIIAGGKVGNAVKIETFNQLQLITDKITASICK